MYAASAIAANTIARSACGAAAPLFTNQMFDAMGIGGGGSLIGGVAAVLAIIPFMFYKYGKGIRLRSKFAPTNMRDAARRKDEERDPISLTDQATAVREELTTSSGLDDMTESGHEQETEVEDGVDEPSVLQQAEKKEKI